MKYLNMLKTQQRSVLALLAATLIFDLVCTNIKYNHYTSVFIIPTFLYWLYFFYTSGNKVGAEVEISNKNGLVKQCPECKLFVPLRDESIVIPHCCQYVKTDKLKVDNRI